MGVRRDFEAVVETLDLLLAYLAPNNVFYRLNYIASAPTIRLHWNLFPELVDIRASNSLTLQDCYCIHYTLYEELSMTEAVLSIKYVVEAKMTRTRRRWPWVASRG